MTKTKPSDGAPEGFFTSVLASRLHGIRASDADDFDNACKRHNVTVTFHKQGEEPKRWPEKATDEEVEAFFKIWRENPIAVRPAIDACCEWLEKFAREMNAPKPEVPRPGARVVHAHNLGHMIHDNHEYLHADLDWYNTPAYYTDYTATKLLDAWRKEEIGRGK